MSEGFHSPLVRHGERKHQGHKIPVYSFLQGLCANQPVLGHSVRQFSNWNHLNALAVLLVQCSPKDKTQQMPQGCHRTLVLHSSGAGWDDRSFVVVLFKVWTNPNSFSHVRQGWPKQEPGNLHSKCILTLAKTCNSNQLKILKTFLATNNTTWTGLQGSPAMHCQKWSYSLYLLYVNIVNCNYSCANLWSNQKRFGLHCVYWHWKKSFWIAQPVEEKKRKSLFNRLLFWFS